MTSRLSLILILLSFFLTGDSFADNPEQKTNISAQEQTSLAVFPFQGKVRGRSVNVRSGSNVNYEIVARVQDGQDIIVLSQVFDWYQILPPEESSFWVHQDFIKDDIVTADAVNVRSGPSLGGSISCQLNRGDIVEVISHEGEWIRIQPPIQARAWIHKDYVIYDKPYEQNLKVLELQKKEKLVSLKKEQLLKEAKEFEESEFFKAVDQINFDEITNKYQAIVKEFPEDETLQTEVKMKLEEVDIKKAKSGVVSASTSETNALPVVTQSLIPKDSMPRSEEPVVSQALDSNNMVFEGKVELERGFGKKRYKLIRNRRRVCFLVEKKFPLRTYLHQNVKVYGKKVSWVYPRVPVVEVEKIEPLN